MDKDTVRQDNKTSLKQDLINHSIWIIIFNLVFAYFGKQMENNTVTTFGQIIWLISALLLFVFLFALTKVLNRHFKQIVLSFVIASVSMLLLNLVLIAIIP